MLRCALLLLGCCASTLGCSGSGSNEADPGAGGASMSGGAGAGNAGGDLAEGGTAGAPLLASVQAGVPDGDDGLGFAPLADGDELRLQTFGQGGTHLLVAVQTTGLGRRAFVSATLTNLLTGVEVVEPPPARPQLLFCADNDECDLVPFLVHAGGLTETAAERHGLRVSLAVKARNDTGLEAEDVCEVVLSTVDL